jgi:UDP-N-acetylglucosamine diphosphorylase/glucosamine-1-phosphate N-acetyltransferase
VSRRLVLFEDSGWRALRPLTDLLPVPALAFGASHLAARLIAATRLPLLSIEARPEAMAFWRDAPSIERDGIDARDDVLALNAAALPGSWLERLGSERGPQIWRSADRILAALAPHASMAAGLARGAGFEAFLSGLDLPAKPLDARMITWPWNLIEWNVAAIADDLASQRSVVAGVVDPRAALLGAERIAVEAGARVDPFAVLDARGGPIRVEADAIVLSHTVVSGPCRVGRGTQLLGGFVARSSFGPQCRVAGEVEDSIWQGHSNKRHHGFIGHSAIGEWVNLGALTTGSDLKNNYGSVRVAVEGRDVDTGVAKIGAIVGAHVKTGIGTLLPTGASIGVGSNLFGGGRFTPRQVPPFAWWNGESLAEHRLEAFLATARVAMSRRDRALDPAEERAIAALFASTAAERAASRRESPAPA